MKLSKDIVGKHSVLISYTFIVSLITACIHMAKSNDYYYFVTPCMIGIFMIISWKWMILDFRITQKEINNQNTYNPNIHIITMIVITLLMPVLSFEPVIDSIIIVGIIFYIVNKVIFFQTINSAIVKLPRTTRDGIFKSKYFFWTLYEQDGGLREYIVLPDDCHDLILYTNLLETKLLLKDKEITDNHLLTYEKEFNKSIFDFNSDELVLVDMAEI